MTANLRARCISAALFSSCVWHTCGQSNVYDVYGPVSAAWFAAKLVSSAPGHDVFKVYLAEQCQKSMIQLLPSSSYARCGDGDHWPYKFLLPCYGAFRLCSRAPREHSTGNIYTDQHSLKPAGMLFHIQGEFPTFKRPCWLYSKVSVLFPRYHILPRSITHNPSYNTLERKKIFARKTCGNAYNTYLCKTVAHLSTWRDTPDFLVSNV